MKNCTNNTLYSITLTIKIVLFIKLWKLKLYYSVLISVFQSIYLQVLCTKLVNVYIIY